MGPTRAGAGGESAGRGADLLTSAAALRWARPDLTAAIADHVLEAAAIAGDQERWLTAAGWAVHARSATGDGRETASDVMGSLAQWGRAPLDDPAARRLRIELALVAAGAGEVETARGLLGPVVADETEPELRADLLCVLARCAVEDMPERVADALHSAMAAWSAVASPAGDVGAASVALISAVVERRNRRPDAAVDHAADGLTRLERGRGSGPSGTPSGHLAAALAAEWISALLDAGRADEARDGCVPLMPRLAEPARASRQLALLRLTVARAVATGDGAASSVGLLEQAAEDAAASDAPDLESVCRTALGALQEQTADLDTALETLRLGVAAERRDRTRMARFRSALADLPPGTLRTAAAGRDGAAGSGRSRAGQSSSAGLFSSSSPSAGSSAHRGAPEPAVTASSGPGSAYDWEEFLRNADGTGRVTGTRSEQAPEDPSGRGKRRRRDDDSRGDFRDESRREPRERDDHRRDDHRDDQRGEPSRRSRRAPEPERAEPAGPAADRREDLFEAARAESSADWEAVPWDGAGAESPIGDLLFRSLRSGDADRRDDSGFGTGTGTGTGFDTVRRNGSNGHHAREDTGRHESPSARPTRNGHGRSRPEDRPGASAETGGWNVAGDLRSSAEDRGRTEERPEPRRRHENGSALDRGSDPAGTDWSSGLRSSRSPERDEDRWPLADSAGRDDPGRSSPRAGSEPRENGPASGNGRRHRAEDPWSTGPWPAATRDDDSGGRAYSGPPTERLPTERLPTTPGADDPESWLRAALADLDRVWGATGPGGQAARQADTGATDTRSTDTRSTGSRARSGAEDRCVVIIDVARDGRRFAGRRAGAVVRAVVDRLTDQLPPGARLRLGESDALSITLPGWDSAAATEWMHRTLPGLLAGFDAGEDLPSAQLRAAVHDHDGPVGAQILQSLERPGGRRHGSGPDRDPARPASHDRWAGLDDHPQDTSRSGRRRASERDTPSWEPAADPDPQDWRQNGSGSRHTERAERGGRRRDAGSGAGNGGGHRHGPEAGADHHEVGHADPGRTTDRGTERAADRGSTSTTGTTGGTGTAAVAGDAKAGSGAAGPESTEGLGIADLLAGALAAYRAI